MLNYLLEVSMYQLILFAAYYLFFKRNTFFAINRFILLGSLLLPFAFPFISFGNSIVLAESNLLPEVVLISETVETIKNIENSNAYSYSWMLILIGQIVFFSLTIFKIVKLLKQIRSCKINKTNNYTLVKSNNAEVYSWFSYVFSPDENLKEEILNHELVHVDQKHSFDILLAEFISNILWFNPFVKFIKNEIDLVHEYEADAKASYGKELDYAEFLVKELFQVSELSLVHNFVKSNQIKNRIKMLTSMRTETKKLYRYLLILPLVALMTLEYSCDREKATQETEIKKSEMVFDFQKVEVQPTVIGVDENLSKEEKYQLLTQSIMNHVKQNFKYPEDAKRDSIQGRVVVSFVYGEDGKVRDAQILRGVSESLDNEAILIVNSLPDVNPAKHNGKNVPVSFMLPITYRLK